MHLSDFDYHLPPELIAQTPIEPRDHSRLLNINVSTQSITETKFFDILDKLGDNDILVLNKTRVINARLHGTIENGKLVEIFLHKQISDNTWDCLVFPGKKLKPGKVIHFNLNNNIVMTSIVKEISDSGRIIEFDIGGIQFLEIVEKLGSIPLPPYIKEKLENNERYQTVFNEIEGSVAAPTAGLHFTGELLKKLKNKGVKIEKVLLHVGLGTFKGVETENILEHKMHSEYIELEQDTATRLNDYKSKGKRIIAVGTTSIRVLESFSNENGILEAGSKDTNIFIYPGYTWKFVDAIITNFHLPKSTLLMLVSSFAGTELIKKAYKYAVDNKFKFFSFGDAMFIEK
ncbi:MAG: tRNA preQ1(34) S-adenosylmethionine ribosyltransferase-isomerase QueA [Candidatus Gracilibacteria bacterium]|nr:tRNA preQ1(34) S-adenosylmethionine ribosyltransferase-isomerase QueA [Candidatus Gracilibacteria bacterium]